MCIVIVAWMNKQKFNFYMSHYILKNYKGTKEGKAIFDIDGMISVQSWDHLWSVTVKFSVSSEGRMNSVNVAFFEPEAQQHALAWGGGAALTV